LAAEQAALDALQARLEAATARLAELEEEHGGEDGFLGALDKIARPEINARLKELKAEAGNAELQLGTSEAGQEPGAPSEESVLREWLDTAETEAALKKSVREAEAALDEQAYQKYPTLTPAEVQALVVDDKWLASLAATVQGELDRVAQTLTTRIRTLAERYATPLPELEAEVTALAAKVDAHLKKMEAAQ
jgi:type I restriction enzyme M protein